MSERGPNIRGPSYAEFFNEQRRVEVAAQDPDLQLAVRYFYEVVNAPHTGPKKDFFRIAHDRIDMAVQAAMMANNLHSNYRQAVIDAANEYMMRNKR